MEEFKDKITEIADNYLRYHDLMTGEEVADKILSLIEKTTPVAEVPCSAGLEKFKALYIAANELMMRVGIDGEISIRDPRCNRLMDSLAALDGGEYDVDKVF